ncbi:MAG: hypothetical protein IPJ41_08600 [Phycisphaerales bacterium]|nr:hypothetical protein [Phycisphaerales bacterium]
MKALALIAAVAGTTLAAPALAETVRVEMTGVVEFNQIHSGVLGQMAAGDPVLLSFDVDSNIYLNSENYPTRGYVIDDSSFTLSAGAAMVPMGQPQPATPYFVIRDNDPAVDGFFLSYGTDFPTSLDLDQQGAFGPFGAVGQVTYSGVRLHSLDILEAVGTYSFGYQSFYFGVTDGPVDAAGFILHEVRISVVSCPADCNGDGAVNTLDVLCFLNHWTASDAEADCNGDGVINTLDVLCFLNEWNAGC